LPRIPRAPLPGRPFFFVWKSLGGMAPELHALAPPEPVAGCAHLSGTFVDFLGKPRMGTDLHGCLPEMRLGFFWSVFTRKVIAWCPF